MQSISIAIPILTLICLAQAAMGNDFGDRDREFREVGAGWGGVPLPGHLLSP